MKYSDFDMKMMALGEIGNHLLALLLAIGSWAYLGELSVFVKIPVFLVVMLLAFDLGARFIHLGYDPEEQ